jgi:predicted ArsR family transcriptional regulator
MRDPIATLALLGEPTRRRLYELVAASHREIGRDEAARQLDISRELAAFHLDRLVEGGLLGTAYRRPPGRGGPGAGRPAKLYRRTEREVAVSLPDRRYDVAADVFAQGLERAEAIAGPGVVRQALGAVATERGRELGTRARRAAGRRPTRERLRRALFDLLARAGYEPEVEPRSGTVSLRNCPYRSVAEAHRDLTCGANLAWAEGLVDGLGGAKLAPELAPAPGRCCVVFAGEA